MPVRLLPDGELVRGQQVDELPHLLGERVGLGEVLRGRLALRNGFLLGTRAPGEEQRQEEEKKAGPHAHEFYPVAGDPAAITMKWVSGRRA